MFVIAKQIISLARVEKCGRMVFTTSLTAPVSGALCQLVVVLPFANTADMFTNVNIGVVLTNVNKGPMLMNVNINPMPTPINSAAVGALVRAHREAAGLTQTQLGERIGASRFWVAAFEKGKSSAELGLALGAIQAVGLTLHIGPDRDSPAKDSPIEKGTAAGRQANHHTQLASLLARATLPDQARSFVANWPTATTALLKGFEQARGKSKRDVAKSRPEK